MLLIHMRKAEIEDVNVIIGKGAEVVKERTKIEMLVILFKKNN